MFIKILRVYEIKKKTSILVNSAYGNWDYIIKDF